MFRKIDAGEIKGLISICFNPKVSLPDNHFVTRCLEKLEFYAAIDFFLNDTARHADIVLPGSLHEEDEGDGPHRSRARIIKVQQGRRVPGRCAPGTGAFSRTWPRPSIGRMDSRSRRRARSSRNCASPARAALPTTLVSPTKRSSARWACSGRATRRSANRRADRRSSRHAAPVRAGSYNPIARAAGRSIFPMAARGSTSPITACPWTMRASEYPIS
jgi:assimilatory nitrate reductase catalytic subunit